MELNALLRYCDGQIRLWHDTVTHIKNQVARVHEGAIEALGALEKEIQAWNCEADHGKQLQRNFLLKELRIEQP